MTIESAVLRPVAQAMRAGKGRLLVGAGLSMQSGLSSWLTLLQEPVRDGLGIELQPWDDLPEIAQFFVDRVPGGRARLIAAVAEDVNRIVAPAPIHESLSRVPIAECWTTNFDTLLERSLHGFQVVEDDAQLVTASRQSSPLLVKMHGTLPTARPTQAEIERVVLTRDDFDTYQERHPRLWSRLAAGYLSGSMLFIGLSLTDPNMRLLQRLARTAQVSGVDASGVVVMKVPDEAQERTRFESRVGDLARSGVTVLKIPEHSDNVTVLEHLRELMRPPRVIVSGSTNSLGHMEAMRAIQAAELLGEQLAQKGTPIVHGGSQTGAALSRRLAQTADVLHQYDPTLITAVRRRILSNDHYVSYPPGPGSVGMPRDGIIRFMGSTPQEMRSELAALGCVVVVLGGGDGTVEELEQFDAAGLIVVPWPATGGTAWAQAHRLPTLLMQLREPVRSQTEAALRSDDLALGAVALANLLETFRAPYADTGPIAR